MGMMAHVWSWYTLPTAMDSLNAALDELSSSLEEANEGLAAENMDYYCTNQDPYTLNMPVQPQPPVDFLEQAPDFIQPEEIPAQGQLTYFIVTDSGDSMVAVTLPPETQNEPDIIEQPVAEETEVLVPLSEFSGYVDHSYASSYPDTYIIQKLLAGDSTEAPAAACYMTADESSADELPPAEISALNNAADELPTADMSSLEPPAEEPPHADMSALNTLAGAVSYHEGQGKSTVAGIEVEQTTLEYIQSQIPVPTEEQPQQTVLYTIGDGDERRTILCSMNQDQSQSQNVLYTLSGQQIAMHEESPAPAEGLESSCPPQAHILPGSEDATQQDGDTGSEGSSQTLAYSDGGANGIEETNMGYVDDYQGQLESVNNTDNAETAVPPDDDQTLDTNQTIVYVKNELGQLVALTQEEFDQLTDPNPPSTPIYQTSHEDQTQSVPVTDESQEPEQGTTVLYSINGQLVQDPLAVTTESQPVPNEGEVYPEETKQTLVYIMADGKLQQAVLSESLDQEEDDVHLAAAEQPVNDSAEDTEPTMDTETTDLVPEQPVPDETNISESTFIQTSTGFIQVQNTNDIGDGDVLTWEQLHSLIKSGEATIQEHATDSDPTDNAVQLSVTPPDEDHPSLENAESASQPAQMDTTDSTNVTDIDPMVEHTEGSEITQCAAEAAVTDENIPDEPTGETGERNTDDMTNNLEDCVTNVDIFGGQNVHNPLDLSIEEESGAEEVIEGKFYDPEMYAIELSAVTGKWVSILKPRLTKEPETAAEEIKPVCEQETICSDKAKASDSEPLKSQINASNDADTSDALQTSGNKIKSTDPTVAEIIEPGSGATKEVSKTEASVCDRSSVRNDQDKKIYTPRTVQALKRADSQASKALKYNAADLNLSEKPTLAVKDNSLESKTDSVTQGNADKDIPKQSTEVLNSKKAIKGKTKKQKVKNDTKNDSENLKKPQGTESTVGTRQDKKVNVSTPARVTKNGEENQKPSSETLGLPRRLSGRVRKPKSYEFPYELDVPRKVIPKDPSKIKKHIQEPDASSITDAVPGTVEPINGAKEDVTNIVPALSSSQCISPVKLNPTQGQKKGVMTPTSPLEWERIMRQNTLRYPKCFSCMAMFSSQTLLKKHMNSRDNNGGICVPEKIKFRCQVCDVNFGIRHNLMSHVRIHGLYGDLYRILEGELNLLRKSQTKSPAQMKANQADKNNYVVEFLKGRNLLVHKPLVVAKANSALIRVPKDTPSNTLFEMSVDSEDGFQAHQDGDMAVTIEHDTYDGDTECAIMITPGSVRSLSAVEAEYNFVQTPEYLSTLQHVPQNTAELYQQTSLISGNQQNAYQSTGLSSSSNFFEHVDGAVCNPAASAGSDAGTAQIEIKEEPEWDPSSGQVPLTATDSNVLAPSNICLETDVSALLATSGKPVEITSLAVEPNQELPYQQTYGTPAVDSDQMSTCSTASCESGPHYISEEGELVPNPTQITQVEYYKSKEPLSITGIYSNVHAGAYTSTDIDIEIKTEKEDSMDITEYVEPAKAYTPSQASQDKPVSELPVSPEVYSYDIDSLNITNGKRKRKPKVYDTYEVDIPFYNPESPDISVNHSPPKKKVRLETSEETSVPPTSPIKCQICNKLFLKKCGLASHMKANHHTKGNVQSSSSPEKIVSPGSTINSLDCPVCKKSFQKRCGLIKHLHTIHPEASKEESLPAKESQEKEKKEDDKESPIPDMEIKEEPISEGTAPGSDEPVGPLQCRICKKQFNKKCGLSKHMVTIHRNDKEVKHQEPDTKTEPGTSTGNFQCSVCQRKFLKKCALMKHYNSLHSTVKEEEVDEGRQTPLQCQICKKTFRKREMFIEHFKSEHDLVPKLHKSKIDSGLLLSQKHLVGVKNKVKPSTNTCMDSDDQLSVKEEPMTAIKKKATRIIPRCKICGRTFKNKSGLASHMNSHKFQKNKTHVKIGSSSLSTNNQRSAAVSKIVAKAIQTRKAIKSASRQSSYVKCHKCNMVLANQEALSNHMKRHRTEPTFICKVCGMNYIKEEALAKHMATHESPRSSQSDGKRKKSKLEMDVVIPLYSALNCTVCKHICASFNDLVQHKKTKHPDIYKYNCRMSNCQRVFMHQSHRNFHESKHKKYETCSRCKERYLIKHGVEHVCASTAEKKEKASTVESKGNPDSFFCMLCGSNHSSAAELRAHQEKHRADKTFKCHLCDTKFTKQANLRHHVLSHYDIRPFQCHICEQTFTRKAHLKNHLLSHSGVRPFSCQICKRKFARKDHLTSHLSRYHGKNKA